MASWTKTDSAAGAPKYLAKDAADSDAANTVFFIDVTEAKVANNIAKGLKTPGWTRYSEYTTNGGSVTRRKVEVLVPMKVTAANAGDLGVFANTDIEDSTVED